MQNLINFALVVLDRCCSDRIISFLAIDYTLLDNLFSFSGFQSIVQGTFVSCATFRMKGLVTKPVDDLFVFTLIILKYF